MLARAVFLDKDGTLIENIPYNVDPQKIQLKPGAGAALRQLHEAGFKLIVVSNQSGVARGLFPIEALIPVEAKVRALVEAAGAVLAGSYFCPHHPQGVVDAYGWDCACRKPKPGLIHQAAREQGVAPVLSWMVGDRDADIEAGRRAGCRTILFGDATGEANPHHVASTWEEVTRLILAFAVRRERFVRG